ncbi:MAG: type 1 glutamine amidotransferase domain-containing protein [Bacteroidales bacterium]
MMNRAMTKIFLTAALIGLSGIFSSCNGPEGNGEKAEKEEKKEKEEKMDKAQKENDYQKVAILVGEDFQDAEAYMPMGYLFNRGIKSKVIGPETGKVKAYNSDFTIEIQKAVTEASVDYFDALIIPGGKAPATLRENEEVLAFVKEFYESGKPIAAICHGPQILISAGIMEGKTATAYKDVQEELQEAGANAKDEPLVVDDQLITSRVPKDLYEFSKAIYKALK